MKPANAALFCLVCCLHLQDAHGARLLLTPNNMPSHVAEMSSIGEELAASGHEVFILLADTNPLVTKYRNGPMKLLTIKASATDVLRDPAKMKIMQKQIFRQDTVWLFRTATEGMVEGCTDILGDEILLGKLKSLRFDLVLTDIFPFSRCLLVLPYKLGLPHVGLTAVYEWWLMRNPALPSVTPFNLLKGLYTDKMTFSQRLHNLYRVLDWVWFPNAPTTDNSLVTKYAPEKPAVTLDHLTRQTSMWLIDTDFVLEFPRPTMPNEVLIGGLTAKPGQPLSEEYETFMQQNSQGVIVITFGSAISTMEPDTLSKFLDALKQVKYGIVWRNENGVKDLPARFKVVKWVPQNDVLAHPNTKLFITHCGANGQFEALYHGVPMLGMPMFAEQSHNAARAQARGYSLTLDMHTFTAADLVQAIETIIHNRSFSDNCKKASAILQDRPITSKQRAVAAIEHVLRHGSDHLHSYALDMPWYQLYMVDILALVILVSHLFIAILWCVCKRLLKGRSSKSDKLKKN